MRIAVAAAIAVPALLSFAAVGHAQEGFAFPSCVASTLADSGANLVRFIPPEVKGAQPRAQLRGVVARSVIWRRGETIKVCFRSGTRKAHERVIRHAKDWMQHANVVFDFMADGAPRKCKGDGHEDIKIEFKDNNGWWSFFGTVSRQKDPSMNLQFFGTDTPMYTNGQPAPEATMRKTILHEFGHALGMLHEHQSPAANCDAEINWDTAYEIGAKMGWPKAQVDTNFRQFVANEEFNMTSIDRKSIMHYSLPPELFKLGKRSPCFVADNLDLSEQDRTFIASIYPADKPLVISTGPTGAATRGVAAGDDKEALVKQYEELLQKAGLAADKVRTLVAEFRTTVLGK